MVKKLALFFSFSLLIQSHGLKAGDGVVNLSAHLTDQDERQFALSLRLHRLKVFIVAYFGIQRKYASSMGQVPDSLAYQFFTLHDLPKMWTMPGSHQTFLSFLTKLKGVNFDDLTGEVHDSAVETKRILNFLDIENRKEFLKQVQAEHPELRLITSEGVLLEQGQALFDMEHMADVVVTEKTRTKEFGRPMKPATDFVTDPLHIQIIHDLLQRYGDLINSYLHSAPILSALNLKAAEASQAHLPCKILLHFSTAKALSKSPTP